MITKGHPWLFVHYFVLSARTVRWSLEYLQRPMRSGNPASYTSVLYITVPPLSAHTTAKVMTQVTGIAPLHDVAVLHLVAGAAVVGIPAVDVVHPAGQTAHVELIEVIDPLYIGAVIYRSPVGFHVDGVVPTYPLQYIVDTFAVAERYLCGWKDDTVLRYEKLLVLHTFVHIIQNGLARDGESTGVGRSGIHRRILRLYRIGLAIRDRLSHVLILVAGILRLHRLRLTAGSAKKQHRC